MDSSLTNRDLAPISRKDRSWQTHHYASLWISLAACIPTYMLAGSLIEEGMLWYQALGTIFLGSFIILIPIVLNGFIGAKYGIPFPVLLRSSFGTRGAIFGALIRGLVGCGWFGIQCWIGGSALYQLSMIIFPSMQSSISIVGWLGINEMQLGCFLIFWWLNMVIVRKGISAIRYFESLSAPILIAISMLAIIWVFTSMDSPAMIFNSSFFIKNDADFEFWKIFWPGLTAVIGFWATLSLNIPDFTRYAVTQSAQVKGQMIGLPFAMVLFSFIGIFVTSATYFMYGDFFWNPIDLIAKVDSTVAVVFCTIGLLVATLSTNIAANLVASANDISNIFPSKINFNVGALITGIIGILIFPWKLLQDPSGYIFKWLIAYSTLLGALGGIMLSDFYLIRKRFLSLSDLYSSKGLYSVWNWSGIISTILAILPVLPGFFQEMKWLSTDSTSQIWSDLYSYAWFITFTLGFLFYAVFSRIFHTRPKTRMVVPARRVEKIY